ncbi:PLP-dependent cysteine synthase family protein [Granulicella cerasi]|uniref:PLP-dependent cysteine synthase family protein n=1 Tax=Granulicella cerasi TaxID=741063 RepID=A0ABW1Z3X2_9BACT|nr:PLP-dependent cysteine synthase family protein [Granulicella cerasi]
MFTELEMPVTPTSAQDIELPQRFEALEGMIGHTPLLHLEVGVDDATYNVFVKCEWKNLTGSIKDRMALHILREGYRSGALKPGFRIVEATSGNTGISFSALGRALGHPVTIFMPDWMSQERIMLMKSFGADVRLVSKAEGGFLGSIAMAEAMAANDPEIFLPRQFSNEANIAAHLCGTGKELCEQMARVGGSLDAFVAGVGTGGTVMGVGAALRRCFPEIRLHPLEPAESPTLTTGCKVGQHRIQGISDEFIPSIVKLETLDAPIAISDAEAIHMAQRLACETGMGVGISSGANLLGAVRVAMGLGAGTGVGTVFADDSKKYLSTDLTRAQTLADDCLAKRVEIRAMRVFA